MTNFGHIRRSEVATAVASGLIAVLLMLTGCSKEDRPVAVESAPKRDNTKSSTFLDHIPSAVTIPNEDDKVPFRLLTEYGAVFVAGGGAVPPPVVIFPDDSSVAAWQAGLRTMRADFGGILIELQAPAMTALMEARAEAQKAGLQISPNGSNAGRRSYEDTVSLWESRVNSGLDHWLKEGQISPGDAARIRRLSPREQIPEILRLEEQGMNFSTDFSRSILSSVAAPGSSQHISMLAFDVREHDVEAVRSALAAHGWFQTVVSDTPHFTYLGLPEDQLRLLGLRKLNAAGRTFWVPDLIWQH